MKKRELSKEFRTVFERLVKELYPKYYTVRVTRYFVILTDKKGEMKMFPWFEFMLTKMAEIIFRQDLNGLARFLVYTINWYNGENVEHPILTLNKEVFI